MLFWLPAAVAYFEPRERNSFANVFFCEFLVVLDELIRRCIYVVKMASLKSHFLRMFLC